MYSIVHIRETRGRPGKSRLRKGLQRGTDKERQK